MKIGVIADNKSVIKHDLEIIQWLSCNPSVELSVLINQEVKSEGLLKLIRSFRFRKFVRLFGFKCLSKIDSLSLFKLDKKIKEYNYNYKGIEDISRFFNKIISISPIKSKSGYVFRYKNEDVENIRNNNLDIIIRSCSGILKGEILKVSKFGIISFHHADNRINRGAPPGFWEIINKSPKTGFTIQVLTEELDGGMVLKRGNFMTKSTFSLNQVYLYCKANYYMKEILEFIIKNKKLPIYSDSIPYSNPLYTLPTIRFQFKYLAYLIKYVFKNLIQSKLLNQDYRWNISYSFTNWKKLALWKSIKIENLPGRYFADPFVVKKREKYYIFVEDYCYKSKLGSISVLILTKDGIQSINSAIKESFHLSYPSIFKYNSTYYMTPESQDNDDIRLYKCVNFPDQWELERIIMKDVKAVDPTIFFHNDLWWLFVNIDPTGIGKYNCSELFIFWSNDPIKGSWESHQQNPIKINPIGGRMGGRVNNKKELYRVSQVQGFNFYGKSINIYKIKELSKKSYLEEKICNINSDFDNQVEGLHHLTSCEDITVFDSVQKTRIN